jgi:hypothetical protein
MTLLKSAAVEMPAFTIGEGAVDLAVSGTRTLLTFTAPATRHLDGGLELSAYMMLYDKDGRFIARRSTEWNKPCLIATRAAWTHEIHNDQLALATRLVYEVEHRFDWRRRMVAGELPPLPAEADGVEAYRWTTLDPRTLEDRIARYDLGLWARSDSFEVTLGQYPKLETETMRTEMEIDLLDAQRQVMYSKNFSVSLNNCGPAYTDTSLRMDRKTLRTLAFFELRGRTESKGIARIAVDLR